MKTLLKNNLKEFLLALLIVAVIIGGFALGQKARAVVIYDPPACQLATQAGDILIDFDGVCLTSVSLPECPSIVRNTNIPAGSYDIFLQSFDGYDTRVDFSQPHEQYFVSFNNSNEIAHTNATDDLPDYIDRSNWSGQVNSDLLLEKNATQAVAQHAFYNDTTSPNSLRAICMVMRPKQVCGNGIGEGNEQCDDGNIANGDGCNSNCQIEASTPYCGDGAINQSSEQCDDGNTANGDGCSSICQNELPNPVCGDGIINQSSEQCDDGNTANGDGCDSTCKNETTPSCGDGIKQSGEECDDGNTKNDDGCSSTCKEEDDDEEDCDASIGDLVWFDLNSNGKKDANEKGIPGITLKLFNGDKVKHKTTDKAGEYKFNNLCEGTYTVMVDTKDIPKGCYQVYDPDKKMDNKHKTELDNGEKYLKADFGYRCSTTPATGAGTMIAVISAILVGFSILIVKRHQNIIAYFRK